MNTLTPLRSTTLWWWTRSRSSTQSSSSESSRCGKPQIGSQALSARSGGSDQLKDICRGHKAWTHARNPTMEEIEQVLRSHPDTTFATCARHKAATVNQLCVQALYEKMRKPVLGTLAGMRLHLTRNIRPWTLSTAFRLPARDHSHGQVPGKDLALFPLIEDAEDGGRVTSYLARPGYAIHKLQGAELTHVTIWLDMKHFKAGGYVALSRVQRDADYLLSGLLDPEHFTPARGRTGRG